MFIHRKQEPLIEAWELTNVLDNRPKPDFVDEAIAAGRLQFIPRNEIWYLRLTSAKPGDYVINDPIAGILYFCKKEKFNAYFDMKEE